MAMHRPVNLKQRRGLILPVILVILLLLGLLSAGFAFYVQADFSAAQAMADRLQCRLAAEAGIQRVCLMLRTERDNPDAWYDNPDEFDQALVWAPGVKPDVIGRPRKFDQAQSDYAYRYSIVADDPFDDELGVRFGITDESSKVNINVASAEQLLKLMSVIVPEDVDPQPLVDALIDWRDADDEPREFGAESEYYAGLPVPYRCKNAPFETVEELLMVKGFDGRILYGEDYDRNGLLTNNEDDGDASFPPDNGDGVLSRGLAPYVTVYSSDYNVANDNKPRINLLMADKAKLREELTEAFENENIVDFIIDGTRTEGTDKTESLADYLEPRVIHNTMTASPIQGQAAATLFDKCTLDPAPQRVGLINVVTAPPIVLSCIEGLPSEAILPICEKRASISGPIKGTTAWLVTEKILNAAQYAAVQNEITGRSRQFTIQSIGFGDHLGLYVRLQAVVEMRGPLAQIIYYRDLTRLGVGFPIRGEEGDRRIVRGNQ